MHCFNKEEKNSSSYKPSKTGFCFRIIIIKETSSGEYSITSLHGSSGIYYEHILNIKVSENSWKLVTYLDISSFESKLDLIDNIFSKTEQICNNPPYTDHGHCTTSLSILNYIIPSLKSKDATLKDLIGHKRDKRSWFGIIGTMFKTVIGTLDDESCCWYQIKDDFVLSKRITE